MFQEFQWNSFMEQIDQIKNIDIPETYVKQFKTKDEFIYPRDKRFYSLAKRVQHDEKLRTQRKWDKDCKMFLLWTMIRFFQIRGKEHVDPTQQEWEELSLILNLDKHALKARWITLINPKQKSQNWKIQEDQVILDSMRQRMHKHIWTQIAVKLYELNIGHCARTPKQVRERWINYLNPNLRKDQWLLKEDLVILNIVLKKGKKWSYISKKLDGRTENQVKNRYKSLLNKILTDNDMTEQEAIAIYIKKNQSQVNSTKQGMVGKRGRHKQIKKLSRQQSFRNNINTNNISINTDKQQSLYLNPDQQEDIVTYLSDSNSPIIQKKQKNNNAIQQSTSYSTNKKQSIKLQKSISPVYLDQQKQGEQYKDFQRDLSNYFNQLSNQNFDKYSPYRFQQQQSAFQLCSQQHSALIQFKEQRSNFRDMSPLFVQQNSNMPDCSPFIRKLLSTTADHEQNYKNHTSQQAISPMNNYNNLNNEQYSAALLDHSPYYIKKENRFEFPINQIEIKIQQKPDEISYFMESNNNPISYYNFRRNLNLE